MIRRKNLAPRLRKRSLAWICIATLAAAGSGVLAWRFTKSSPPLSYDYRPGECLIYKIDYRSVSEANFGSLFENLETVTKEGSASPPQSGLFQSFSTELRGGLIMTVLESSAERWLISFRLEEPFLTLEINGQEAPFQAEISGVALRLDVFAEVDHQGRVGLVYFDPEVDSFSRNLARALMAQAQFVFPAGSGARLSQWGTEEDDPNGRCIASYELLSEKKKHYPATSNGQKRVFVKTKISYLNLSGHPGAAETTIPMAIFPRGNMVGAFDQKKGLLVSLDGTEGQEVTIAGKRVAQASSTLTLEFLEKERIAPDELRAMLEAYGERKMGAPALTLAFVISEEEREAIIQRSELGQATKESLLADLVRAEGEGKKRDTPLYLKFKALIFVHPEVCQDLGRLLAGSHPGSLTMGILSEALSGVGHEEAQAALVGAIQTLQQDSTALPGIVEQLGLVKMPTQQAEETIRKLAVGSSVGVVADAAILALGNMARNLEERESERANQIVDWIVSEIQEAQSEARIRLFLLSLGNAGSRRALKTILRFAEHPSSSLRSVAVSGLRWVDSEEADDWLARVLTSDEEASVRLEAVFALSFRKLSPETFQAIKKALLGDQATMVRLSILKNLLQPLDDSPDVRRLIKQAAEKDPSPEVRRAASDIVALNAEKYLDD